MKYRIEKFSTLLKEKKLDAFLVSSPENIYYFTGNNDAQGYLMLDSLGQIHYFSNPLYKDFLKNKANYPFTICHSSPLIEIEKYIFRLKYKKIGFEAENLSKQVHSRLEEDLGEKNIEFIETFGLIGQIREIKSKEEINFIKEAISITKQALNYSQEIVSTTMSEKLLSIELERFMRIKGDNQIAFPTIVANGKNTIYPHHQPEDNLIKPGPLLIDLGAKYKGYCADLTRTIFWGKMPKLFQDIYSIIKKAQDLAIQQIKDGVKASKIDQAARQYIESKGLGKYFLHGIGHGIGLEVHEWPNLNTKSEQILKTGMVLTIEPAVYIPGKLGIRIEDVVLVKDRNPEILSKDN